MSSHLEFMLDKSVPVWKKECIIGVGLGNLPNTKPVSILSEEKAFGKMQECENVEHFIFPTLGSLWLFSYFLNWKFISRVKDFRISYFIFAGLWFGLMAYQLSWVI